MKWREHGINATYQAGCRCEECRFAHAQVVKGYRTGTIARRSKIINGESVERVDRMIALAFGERAA